MLLTIPCSFDHHVFHGVSLFPYVFHMFSLCFRPPFHIFPTASTDRSRPGSTAARCCSIWRWANAWPWWICCWPAGETRRYPEVPDTGAMEWWGDHWWNYYWHSAFFEYWGYLNFKYIESMDIMDMDIIHYNYNSILMFIGVFGACLSYISRMISGIMSWFDGEILMMVISYIIDYMGWYGIIYEING